METLLVLPEKNFKNRQKVSKMLSTFSTIFAGHQFSGPFWGPLTLELALKQLLSGPNKSGSREMFPKISLCRHKLKGIFLRAQFSQRGASSYWCFFGEGSEVAFRGVVGGCFILENKGFALLRAPVTGISLKAINSSKRVLKITGPSLSRMNSVIILARTACQNCTYPRHQNDHMQFFVFVSFSFLKTTITITFLILSQIYSRET